MWIETATEQEIRFAYAWLRDQAYERSWCAWKDAGLESFWKRVYRGYADSQCTHFIFKDGYDNGHIAFPNKTLLTIRDFIICLSDLQRETYDQKQLDRFIMAVVNRRVYCARESVVKQSERL